VTFVKVHPAPLWPYRGVRLLSSEKKRQKHVNFRPSRLHALASWRPRMCVGARIWRQVGRRNFFWGGGVACRCGVWRWKTRGSAL